MPTVVFARSGGSRERPRCRLFLFDVLPHPTDGRCIELPHRSGGILWVSRGAGALILIFGFVILFFPQLLPQRA